MGNIRVSNLGKGFKQYKSSCSRLREWITPGNRQYHKLKWVLQDINFSVLPGEAVGIIGTNGAGKSTLLKLITGTSQPTLGSVYMTGRVAALLELGLGFHPDFTGRQNVYMAGQLLGMSNKEVSHMMPEIEEFSGVGEYIDMPVRVYSSGMQMRLAFSVATARRPDILIVDEALAVGDSYFQHKCFDRIRKFRQEGTTLLLVSHDKAAIQAFCDRAILLDRGRIAMEGLPETVMDHYNALILSSEPNQVVTHKIDHESRLQTISGTREAMVANIALFDGSGTHVDVLFVGQPVSLRVIVKVHNYLERLVFGFGIKDRLGQLIYGTNSDIQGRAITNIESGDGAQFVIRFNVLLGPGTYSIHTALTSSGTEFVDNFEWREHALFFSVVNSGVGAFSGSTWLDAHIEASKELNPKSEG